MSAEPILFLLMTPVVAYWIKNNPMVLPLILPLGLLLFFYVWAKQIEETCHQNNQKTLADLRRVFGGAIDLESSNNSKRNLRIVLDPIQPYLFMKDEVYPKKYHLNEFRTEVPNRHYPHNKSWTCYYKASDYDYRQIVIRPIQRRSQLTDKYRFQAEVELEKLVLPGVLVNDVFTYREVYQVSPNKTRIRRNSF